MLLNTNYLCLAVLKELNFEKEHKLYTFKQLLKSLASLQESEKLEKLSYDIIYIVVNIFHQYILCYWFR